MDEITVKMGYCEKHYDRYHMVDEKGKCYGRSMAEMRAQGYFYIRHIGGGWYRFRVPGARPYGFPWEKPKPEPPEHDIHVLEPDF